MLPPGHIAGGFLVAEALLKIAKPDLAPFQINQLLWWGVFFGFAPDFDNFAAFTKVKAWWYKKGVDNTIHRRFYTHIPILWLIAGLSVYFVAQSEFVKMIGIMVWLGSWTHFALDSIDYGVMWLWPWSKKVQAVHQPGKMEDIKASSFFEYWWNFLRIYVTLPTFYVELVLVAVSIVLIFKF
jgi:hypothetical protein